MCKKLVHTACVVVMLLMTMNVSANGWTNVALFDVNETNLRIIHDGQSLDVSLYCPTFTFNGTSTASIKPSSITGDIQSGEIVAASFVPVNIGSAYLEPQLLMQWSPNEGVLRKWVRYRLAGDLNDLVLQEIVLETISKTSLLSEPIIWVPQSYPAYANGFFMGIEFPIASTRIEGQDLILAYKPGLRPQAGIWYESRKAVYGLAAIGKERKAFEDYITLHRPEAASLHISYNTWWSAPNAVLNENDILTLMRALNNNLITPYGVSLDDFTIDFSWSNVNSIYQINTSNFPNGFTNIKNYAQSMGTVLGVYSSPSVLQVGALDATWAQQNGYETYRLPWVSFRQCCIAGPKYVTAYRNSLLNLAYLYNVRAFKFDGYNFTCNESNHGHEPNELAGDAMAQSGINMIEAIRAAYPGAWFEAAGCFTWNPSPWWLFHVTWVTSPYGDDAPTGRSPCPIYRESYTTARDFYNLQGASLLQLPINAQHIMGIVHQTTEPFLNDGVMVAMRGHGFFNLFLNPNYMSGRWSALAQLLTWARNNSSIILANTYPLLPASWLNGNEPKFTNAAIMPREIYGYAHCLNNQGRIVLRNPWIRPQTYKLTLNDSIGFDSQAAGLSAVSLYPENRVYGQNLNYGDTLSVPIAPYETVVLSIGSGYDLNGIPAVGSSIGVQLQSTSTVRCAKSNSAINLQATVDSNAPQTKLLVCMEGTTALANPTYQLIVNGSPANVTTISSESGWSATAVVQREHWIFLQVDLTSAHNVISLENLQPDTNCTKVSVWAWATKAGSSTPRLSNSLPSPELISLDANLLGNFDLALASQHLPGDFNEDCYVDFNDFAVMASYWLVCNEPTNVNCE